MGDEKMADSPAVARQNTTRASVMSAPWDFLLRLIFGAVCYAVFLGIWLIAVKALRVRRKRFWALLSVPAFLAIVMAGYAWYAYEFPYGESHCCDVGLWFGLREYAEKHNGRFPAGQATPEASLSLLYGENAWGDPKLLRGKTVPESVVREILERGELLGPDTCGWHYVEGLTLADDPRLALFWDKAGLGHIGQRLPNGDRIVCLIRNCHEYIPGEKWADFLQEQEKLWAARTKEAVQATPTLCAKVRLPSGEVVDHFDAGYTLSYMEQHESSHGSGRSITPSVVHGDMLRPNMLRWWRLSDLGMGGAEKGLLTLNLTLGEWRSAPVEIKISDGVPIPRSFIFDLTAARAEQPQTLPRVAQPAD
jgi:hypothetical protein